MMPGKHRQPRSYRGIQRVKYCKPTPAEMRDACLRLAEKYETDRRWNDGRVVNMTDGTTISCAEAAATFRRRAAEWEAGIYPPYWTD